MRQLISRINFLFHSVNLVLINLPHFHLRHHFHSHHPPLLTLSFYAKTTFP